MVTQVRACGNRDIYTPASPAKAQRGTVSGDGLAETGIIIPGMACHKPLPS